MNARLHFQNAKNSIDQWVSMVLSLGLIYEPPSKPKHSIFMSNNASKLRAQAAHSMQREKKKKKSLDPNRLNYFRLQNTQKDWIEKASFGFNQRSNRFLSIHFIEIQQKKKNQLAVDKVTRRSRKKMKEKKEHIQLKYKTHTLRTLTKVRSKIDEEGEKKKYQKHCVKAVT